MGEAEIHTIPKMWGKWIYLNTRKVWENTEIFHILRYLADLDLIRTHAIPNVWECTNSPKMEMFCGKPYYTQGVGFLGNPNNPQSMVNPKSETLGILWEKLMKIYSHAMGFDQKSLN